MGHDVAAGGGVSLGDAKVVVGGGRGMGSAEAFAMLDELAGLLGAAVGVSRVATSLGWRPHAQQIGQTGTRIAPDLYIACGISGAIQHIVGAKSAKRILVINTDRDAPIFRRAELRGRRRRPRGRAGDQRRDPASSRGGLTAARYTRGSHR